MDPFQTVKAEIWCVLPWHDMDKGIGTLYVIIHALQTLNAITFSWYLSCSNANQSIYQFRVYVDFT